MIEGVDEVVHLKELFEDVATNLIIEAVDEVVHLKELFEDVATNQANCSVIRLPPPLSANSPPQLSSSSSLN